MTSSTGPAYAFPKARTISRQPEMVLAAVIVFLSPFNVLRVPGIYFTVSDICTLIAFFFLIVRGRLSLTPFAQFSSVWFGGFIALAGGLLIGSIANQRLVEGAEVLAQYFFAMVIVPMAIARRSVAECHTLIGIFVLSIFVTSLHGIYLIDFAKDPPMNFVSGSGRLRGVVERSNETAALGALALVAAMYLAAEGRLRRIVALPAIGVILYGIILTASSTGILAVTAGVLAFTALQGSGRHFVNLGILAGCGGIALAVFGTDILPSSFMDRVAGAIATADITRAGTFDGRLALIQEAWHRTADHLVIGLGADGYRATSIYNQPVHNTYVLLLLEGGLVSMAGLAVIFASPAVLGISHVLHRETRNRGALIVATAVIFLIVLNAFAHVFARFWIVPVVLMVALAIASDDYLHSRSTPPRKR